jgi:hypothetical protein
MVGFELAYSKKSCWFIIALRKGYGHQEKTPDAWLGITRQSFRLNKGTKILVCLKVLIEVSVGIDRILVQIMDTDLIWWNRLWVKENISQAQQKYKNYDCNISTKIPLL